MANVGNAILADIANQQAANERTRARHSTMPMTHQPDQNLFAAALQASVQTGMVPTAQTSPVSGNIPPMSMPNNLGLQQQIYAPAGGFQTDIRGNFQQNFQQTGAQQLPSPPSPLIAMIDNINFQQKAQQQPPQQPTQSQSGSTVQLPKSY